MRNGYKKIEVYFPDTEYEAFLKKVRRTNLSISEFVRRMAAEQVIREAPHADDPLLIREVKRVGNNINQLLFLVNSKGFFDMVNVGKILDLYSLTNWANISHQSRFMTAIKK